MELPSDFQKMKEIDKSIVITAIIGIVILEAIALWIGYNGALLTLVVASIAGLAGWFFPSPYQLKGGAKHG